MNVIEYFDQVRIINMVSREDRRQETISEFTRYGFPINTNKVSFFDAITPDDAGDFSSPGIRGCFLSHMQVLEEAGDKKVSPILVLEDDIQFSKHIAKYGAAAIESLNGLDWDIIYFGHALENVPGEASWRELSEPMLLAHFYAINGKTLAKLTDFLHKLLERPPGHPDGGPMHYDGALNTFMQQNPEMKAYYFSKNLGYQRPSSTNLHQLSVFDSNPFLKPIITVLRKLKTKYLRFIR